MRPPALALVLLLIALAPPPAAAQTESVLDVQVPYVTGEAEDGLYPRIRADLAVPWSLAFQNAALAAAELGAGNATLSFTVLCEHPLAAEPSTQALVLEPAQDTYEGTATVHVTLPDSVAGIQDVLCDVTGVFQGARGRSEDTGQVTVPVRYQSAIEAVALTPTRQAGPQKQIPYPVEVTNHGLDRVELTFDVAKKPGGRWHVLVPERMVLDPGQTATAIVVVATPFENGYVRDDAEFVLRILPAAVGEDAEEAPSGTPVEVPLKAHAEGFYIPGSGVPAALLGLALLAVLRRRP